GMEKLDEDSRNVINFFIKSLLVMAPYTPDNFLEDFLIQEHLKKEHGIESREIERLFSSVISEKDIFKFINSVKNLSEKNENLKILGFKSTIENAPILMSDKLDKSKLKSIIQNFREVVNYIYFLGDWAFCSSMGIDLEEYYKKKIREMLDRKRKFSNAKTIFKEAIYYRFQLELNRLNHFKAMAQKLILFNSIL
ncbi:MAG: hypothetical protein RMI31_00820, partial [Archaeoglobaceae archaeon]|nr:hypothetical protein [Archaeoglobaceae archaeon]